INDNSNLFLCYNVLGITQGALGEIEKSLSYYNEALFYLKKDTLNDFKKARILNNIGIVYKNNKQYNKAIENFKTVVSTNGLEMNEPGLYAVGLSNLAASKLYNNDTVGINSAFSKAIAIKKKNNQIPSLAGTYFNYAEFKYYAKDTTLAIEFAKKAEQLSIQSENNEKLLETWAFLAELDKDNASNYFKKYRDLDDRLQKEERQLQNKFARIRFETDEFIAENVELESEKESLFKQKQMWTGIAAGFFLLGLSIYIVVNERSRKQKLRFDRQQQETNQEIFNLMLTQKQKVDEVKRMEQKRISEELHDGVLGKMLGARMVLTGLNKRATEEAINEKSKAISSLQEIENEIRTISHELSHSAYQKINNFTDSIAILLQNSSTNTPITANFNFNVHEDWDALDGEIKINVYRIVQETFHNALKHAQCTEFNVTFDIDEDHFNIMISDNGKGFNVNKRRKGIGMRNIGSRVLKLNGVWNTHSIKGEGTTITMKFPLKKNLKNNLDTNMQYQNV
ncbi:MAG: ATP-binding protein, partial [Maribacter sp.]